MSWSNQEKDGVPKKDLATLERNYADAELAYQSLKREYDKVLGELTETKLTVIEYHHAMAQTEKKFEELKEQVLTKEAEYQRLVDQNKQYLIQLDHVKTTFEQEITHQVEQAIVPYQQKILRMDRFAEYFPVFLALTVFGTILYVLFWK